jgi:hypothetical protein
MPGKRSSLHLRSIEEALREILAISSARGKAAPHRAHEKRQPITRKATTAKAKKKRKK